MRGVGEEWERSGRGVGEEWERRVGEGSGRGEWERGVGEGSGRGVWDGSSRVEWRR